MDMKNRVTAIVLGLLLVTASAWLSAEEILWTYEPVTLADRADPPIPSVNVQLILDDDSTEGVFGVGVPTASQFMWLNQFSPGLLIPLQLEEIWVLFPPGDNIAPGAAVEIVVYHDPDGDPSNGADLVASYDETIQVVDGNTFSVYTLNPPLEIIEPGDVLIGVVNRFVTTGVTSTTRPAAMDVDVSQGRSWLGVWTADPASPPVLPADGLFQPIDGFVPGNWMIRAFGTRILGPAIPTQTTVGIAVLTLLLALAGVKLLLRRS